MDKAEPTVQLFPTRCHSTPQVSCVQCRLSAICLPISLHVDDVEKIDRIIQRGRPLQRGEFLYRAKDTFRSVYAVRSGSIKTMTMGDDGEEQVTGFYLPGEIFGLDGLANDCHSNSAVALETAAVCEIPFNQLEGLSAKIAKLQRHLFRLMAREITADQQLIALLSKHSADERVATLLLSISSRNSRRHLSATHFRLPMSRAEIGNYLGLTVETVSRVLGRFQKQGIIAVDKKEIVVLDLDALRDLSLGQWGETPAAGQAADHGRA